MEPSTAGVRSAYHGTAAEERVTLERANHRYRYAIGKRVDEGAIQEIMTKMFYPPETKPIDTTEE